MNQGVQTRTFAYNSLSRLVSAQNPESGTIQYSYDANGNLTQKTDARGITTAYTYDALNRVLTRTYTGETGYTTPNVSYFYDNLPNAKGKLTKVSSAVSTTEYTAFDILGRVLGAKQTTAGGDPLGYTTGYTYNLSGALIEETYPSGRKVKNVLDNYGELSLVQSARCGVVNGVTATCSDPQGYFSYAKNFTYNAAGAVTSMQLGNGRWETTQFNSRLQPTQIGLGTVQNATDKLKLDYEYGAAGVNNGNITKQTITVPTVGANAGFTAVQNYTYDELNRLKSAVENVTPAGGTASQSWKQTYTFDRYGNRRFDEANTTMPSSFVNPAVTNPTIGASNNRLTSPGYSYDASGNTTADANGQTYVYDAENKMISASSSSGTLGEYFYDGDGKRVKKHVPATGELTIFVYDAGGKLIGEYSTEISETPKVSYTTSDHLGSPRIITDENGMIVSRRDFMPYGEEIFSAGRTTALGYTADTIRQKFTGKERDKETGLDYYFARYYVAGLGRFSAADYQEMGFTSVSPRALPFSSRLVPQSLNLFSYVLNNPLNIEDTNGHGPKRIRIPNERQYTCRADINNPNDSPNIHIFDKRGNEVARVAIKPGKDGPFYDWQEYRAVPRHLKDNVELLAQRKGWTPRLPLSVTRTNAPEIGVDPVEETPNTVRPSYRGVGRGRGNFNNAFAGLLILDAILNAIALVRDSDRLGYYSYAGVITITDVNKAAKNLPGGPFNIYEYEGRQYWILKGKFVDRSNDNCFLEQGANGSIKPVCIAGLPLFLRQPDFFISTPRGILTSI